MTSLILSMIRARWGQAVTLFLLASLAVAAAVAGPVSDRATDAAVVSLEVGNATDRERTISVGTGVDPTSPDGAERFDALTQLVSRPGFEVYRAGEITAFGPGLDVASARELLETRVVFRDGVCDHVTILDGRCLIGTDEIIVGERTAARQGLAAGDVATIIASSVTADGTIIPAGQPGRMTVVGIYRPVQTDEAYWAGQGYFRVTADGTRAEAVFTTEPSMEHIGHTAGASYVDVVVPPQTLTGERIAGIGAEIEELRTSLSRQTNVVITEIPELARRVQASRELAGQLGPVAFVPLAAISFFVIYLAVGYGVFGRRDEIGLVALRGVAARRRWLLAAGEAVVPILAAAPVGYVLGYLGADLVLRPRLGSGGGVPLSIDSLPYATAAIVVALGVALLGQRRGLREPVVELLRGVPRTVPVWRALTVEALVGTLAVLATVQLRSSASGITGLGVLGPGLLVVGVAVVAARAVIPLAGVAGRSTLRRGLLGAGLAAVQVARRPGSQQLFVLVSVGTAMLSFVTAGAAVAAQARDDRATVTTGAHRVLHVAGADARDLLRATHQLDPDGEWAMAATALEPLVPDDPPVLAVDASRLATVASWRSEFGADPTALAAAISPPAPASPGYMAPLELWGTTLELDAAVAFDDDDESASEEEDEVDLRLDFVRLPDGLPVAIRLRNLGVGRQTVRAGTQGCEDGCRLVSFTILGARVGAKLTLYSLRQLDPEADVIPPSELGRRERWRPSVFAGVTANESALVVRMTSGRVADRVQVGVLDAPTPVPVAAVGPDRRPRIVSLDGQYVETDETRTLSMLPRLGQQGVLADIGYLEQTLIDAPARENGEIWLGPAAPADAAEQFRELGLAVVDETGVAQEREALARQGPALALQFHLAAAVLGMLLALGGLGLVAAVDRRARAADLRALRVQGLRRRMARRAALWGYLSTVVLGAVTGLVGAAVAWVAAGDRLPIFSDGSSALDPPRWPRWSAVAAPWGAATLALVLGAVVAAWVLRRAIARPPAVAGARVRGPVAPAFPTPAVRPRPAVARSSSRPAGSGRRTMVVVIAADGTVTLPPEVLAQFPPGTRFTLERRGDTVSFQHDVQP